MTGYQPIVIPFNYPGIFGGNGKSRTFTEHRMKVLHYRYATLPYVNTLHEHEPTCLLALTLVLRIRRIECVYIW